MTPRLPLPAWLILSLALPCAALAGDEAQIIARVSRQIVTTADVAAYAALVPPEPDETPEMLRDRARDLLLAGLLAQTLLLEGAEPPPEDLRLQLQEAQRRIALDYYIASHAAPYTPGAAEIAAFARDNPQMFEDRATYRYVEILLPGLAPERERQVRDLLSHLPDGPLATAEAAALMGRLREADIPFRAQSAIRSSEQLPAGFASLLDGLWAAPRRFSLQPGAAEGRLVLLLDRLADPVEASDMRAQIAQGLTLRNAADQRRAIIRDLAEAAMDSSSVAPTAAPPAALPAPRPAPSLLLLPTALMAALAAAAIGLAVSWMRAARPCDTGDEQADLPPDRPLLRRLTGISLIALATLGFVLFVLPIAPDLGAHRLIILPLAGALAGILVPAPIRWLSRGQFIFVAPVAVALLLAAELAVLLSIR